MVFFEAPHRLAEMLGDAASAFGAERRAAVCRELTKTWEQVRRGTLQELAEWAAEGVKGEVTVVVAGRNSRTPTSTPSWTAYSRGSRQGSGSRT